MTGVPLPVKLKKVSVAQDPLLVHVQPFVAMESLLVVRSVMIATKPTV